MSPILAHVVGHREGLRLGAEYQGWERDHESASGDGWEGVGPGIGEVGRGGGGECRERAGRVCSAAEKRGGWGGGRRGFGKMKPG